MGRYYHFRLHPFSVAELLKHHHSLAHEQIIETIFSGDKKPSSTANDAIQKLFQYGPFPEPLLATDHKLHHLWQRNRIEKIIREDLRDLSRLPEIDFLILKNKQVFLAIETKYADEHPSPTWGKFLYPLGCHHGVQLVMKPGVFKIHQFPGFQIAVMSASQFLQYLI